MAKFGNYVIDRNGFKIQIKEVGSYVDEKNKRCVKVVDWRLVAPDAFNTINEHGNFNICGRAKGVSVLHNEDKFDAEKGLKIARARAESNAYFNASTIVSKRVSHAMAALINLESLAKLFAYKSNAIVNHNNEYISRVADGE